ALARERILEELADVPEVNEPPEVHEPEEAGDQKDVVRRDSHVQRSSLRSRRGASEPQQTTRSLVLFRMRMLVALVLLVACDQGTKPKPAAPPPVEHAAPAHLPDGPFTGAAWDAIAPLLTFHRAN